MKNFPHSPLRWQRVARLCGERLTLDPALRRELLDEMRREVARAGRRAQASCPSGRAGELPRDDRRAFAESVAFERLGEFCLCLGMDGEAAAAFREAALCAIDGEQYDHGGTSLPGRFLRIRFYGLLERISACRATGLEGAPRDEVLAACARRLGGAFL